MSKTNQILLFNVFFLFLTFIIKAGDPHPNPIANFEVSNLCYKSVTGFSNTSTSLQNPVFGWTIYQQGNATPIYTSSATNINFQFPAKTTYTVILSVINYVTPTHTHSDDIQRVILIDSIPIANFDLEPCQSIFTNLSCCANSYVWDFGDGTPTSTLTSPIHTYSVANSYTVTLTATDGTQTVTTSQTIVPYADVLTGNFNIVYDADTIRFNAVIPTLDDSLKANFWDWEWDLGDGTTFDLYGPAGWSVKHHYQPAERDSVYPVILTVKDLCFEVEKQKTVRIKGIGKNVTSTYVFPSPVVHGYLNIESNEKDKLQEIKIIDCLGKKLDHLIATEKPYGYYFYVGQLPAGIYIVELLFTDRVENHKIIKE